MDLHDVSTLLDEELRYHAAFCPFLARVEVLADDGAAVIAHLVCDQCGWISVPWLERDESS